MTTPSTPSSPVSPPTRTTTSAPPWSGRPNDGRPGRKRTWSKRKKRSSSRASWARSRIATARGRGKRPTASRAGVPSTFVRKFHHEASKIVTPLEFSLNRLRAELDKPDLDRAMLARHVAVARERLSFLWSIIDRARIATQTMVPRFTRAPLRPLIERARAHLLDRLGPGAERLHMTIDVDPALHLDVDGAALLQALQNFLQNAVEAYRDEVARLDVTVTAGTLRAGSLVEILVTDRGPGMRPDVLAQLFVPFSTSKPGGTGVGLLIARTMIEEVHGGTLEIESAEGRGTTVKITLPARQTGTVKVMIPSPHRPYRIEDDHAIADVLKDLVTSLGHAFRHAVTLADVRGELSAGGFCYVLLDMQIPADGTSVPQVGCGETALGLIRAIDARRNARGKHLLPVLIVTAYSRDPSYISKMLTEMDADDFIAKPLGDRLDLILDRIRSKLASAERADHSACVAPAPPAAAVPTPRSAAPTSSVAPLAATRGPIVRMAIDGTRGGRKTIVKVQGEARELQDGLLPVLVSLILLQTTSPGAWAGKTGLAMARKRYAPSRIRKTFEGLVPEGFEIVQYTAGGEFRLNPNVVVENVEWEALVDHPELEVQKVAREQVRRRRVGERG